MFNDYFDEGRTEEMANASSEERSTGVKLEYPGKYRMAVVTKKFMTKNGEVMEFPNLKKTKTNSLGLNFILETVDSTDKVPAGASTYGMIVIAPAPGASEKKVKDTMSYAKPRLAALLGPKKMAEFKFDEKWILENLTAEFKKVRGKDQWEVEEDHSLKQEVMVTFDVGEYKGEATLNLVGMKPALTGDSSITTGVSIKDQPDAFDDDDQSSADLESIDKLAEEPFAPVSGVEVPSEF